MQFSNMLLQIKVSTEAFPTGYTSKRLLIVVSMHMKSQIINLMKGFVANCTFILLFAAVRQFVILVVSLLVKALSTEFACEWFVSSMNPYMRV